MSVRAAQLPAFPTCHALSASMVDDRRRGICFYFTHLLSILFLLYLVLLPSLFPPHIAQPFSHWTGHDQGLLP